MTFLAVEIDLEGKNTIRGEAAMSVHRRKLSSSFCYCGGGSATQANLTSVGMIYRKIFFAFTLVASVISNYTGTAYHTCLYIWAREAEQAQAAGQSIQVAPPAPLAAVLG